MPQLLITKALRGLDGNVAKQDLENQYNPWIHGSLLSLFSLPLLVSKHTFWQDWQEQSPQKAISCPQPLSPEQMLQDKHTTCVKVSEVKSMLQELLDSTMFNQGEVRAIRYMSAVVENLNKALILQHKENRSLEAKYRHLKIEMTKELSNQKLYFQKSLQVLESKRDALLKQIDILGGKYHDLLLIKHALEFQLKKIQSAGGQAEDLVRVLVEFPDPDKKEALPKKDTVMEETQQEPKKEEQFSPCSPSPMAMAWDSGAMPSPDQPLSTMTVDSRIADVYRSKDAESLQPVLPSSMDHMFPKKWERLSAESPGDRAKDQDFFQEVAWEKEGLQIKSHFQKQLSLERSRKLALESKAEAREEELSWERRRQQWQQEEEMWLQRQERWALLEQEHEEKLRQWEAEEAAREQRLRLDQEPRGPWREPEQPGEDAERMIFVPIIRWKDSEDASLAPPPSRAQSARQGRRPCVPRSPKAQQPIPRNQRSMSSAEFTQKPQAHRLPVKPKKSASFPVTGTSPRRVTQPPVHIAPVTRKEKVYHIDVEAQRRNLRLLTEEDTLGLPHYLHGKALELTTTTMELNALKLWCLFHKYICYRHFQSLRQDVINHIQVVREAGASYKAQNLFLFLENVDHLQKLQLQVWTDKQKDLEEKRRGCLSSMATMFPKLQEWNVNLHTPVVISPKSRKSKPPPFLLRHIHSSSPFCKRSQELFKTKHQPRVPQQMARQQGNQMEAMWKIDVAASSYPIEKKTPTSLSWDQLGGFPDIPRLLALDVQSSFHKSLMSLKARASVTQRKEEEEPPEESAELVHKKSNESFPGTLRSQKDRDNPSPIPCLSQ